MKRVVRLCEVRLENFKNTVSGVVKIPEGEHREPFDYSSGILGVYGQNGSGKTAIIEALQIIKTLLSGGGLRDFPLADYMMYGKENCTIGVRFSIEHENEEDYYFFYTDYEVRFARAADGTAEIRSEILKAEKTEDGKVLRRTLVDYDTLRDVDCFLPKYRYEAAARTRETAFAIGVAQRLAKKEKGSFLFSAEGQTALRTEDGFRDFHLGLILDALFGYAGAYLFVISSVHSALISLGENALMNIRLEDDEKALAGAIPLVISGPEVVTKEYFELLSGVLTGMNYVLKELIPGLTIGIHSLGAEMRRDGQEGVRIEMVSRRGDSVIPIRYESEGIIKIVTILNVLISAYTDPSVCLVIDELDSGIFEYLLGELLTVMDDYGKGQLIFTSHNLRPLEMLDRKNLVFSTTNPENRYIHMQYVKQNNNMRDMYLRSIMLGGQKEELYEETDTNQIARAFRRAGRAIRDGKGN